MNAPARRGACPALSAPMSTGDGLLVRLSPADGRLSPAALVGLCEGAIRHGNGILEVTARGSVQIRGLDEVSAPRFADHVAALGIEVRTGLTVDNNPLAGFDPAMIADPRPLAQALLRRWTHRAAPLLGPKVSVVIDGGGRFPLHALKADIRLAAVLDNGGAVLWRLSLAGQADADWLLTADDAVAAMVDLLEAIAALGIDARGRDIPDARLPASRLPGAQHTQMTDAAPATEGDILFLTDGRFALVAALPFGSIEGTALLRLAADEAFSPVSEVRPAPARRLILLCPSSDAAEQLRRTAGEVGLVVAASDPRISIAACPGAPACASGRIATRALAGAIAARLASGPNELALHVSGCAKGCARQAPADLVIAGEENGAGLVIGGTAATPPLAWVGQSMLERLPHFLAPLAGLADRPQRLAALRQMSMELAGSTPPETR